MINLINKNYHFLSIKVVFLAEILLHFFLTLTEEMSNSLSKLDKAKYPEDLFPFTKPIPLTVSTKSNFLKPNILPVGIFFSPRLP